MEWRNAIVMSCAVVLACWASGVAAQHETSPSSDPRSGAGDESAMQDEPGHAFPPPPRTEPEPISHVEWNPRWRKAGLWDGMTIGAGMVIIIGDMQLEYGQGKSNWSKPILWDDAVRDALRLEVAADRDTAATISDVMMMGSLIHNIIFDNLVVAWVLHGEPEVAWQMSAMDAEAYAIALSLTSVVKAVSARSRPLVEECDADPEYSLDCTSLNRYRSFFSGHAATTGVGAGLLCAHHLNMPLYDGGILDVGTCAMGIVLTMATGALRIASDNHWATDVTTGHLVGFASGFLVPTLLYYNEDDEPRDDRTSERSDERRRERPEAHALVLPAVNDGEIGVRLVGVLP